ncbi:MAG: acyl-CoA thioesterase [Zoogloeaceae bacterium]|nr:acyl-CoA thioesterase [Zoogloeaceae bacterium]
MPEIRHQKEKSVITLKVRGYHVDVFGHVNHARYLEFLEEARWAFFDDWPVLTAALHARSIVHAVVNITADYKSQATVGDLLRVETAPVRVGNSSLVVAQSIKQMGTGKPVVDAKITSVFLESASGKTTSIRDDFLSHWPRLSEEYR